MLTGQECSGNSFLHLEDFRNYLFGSLIYFFSVLGLKERNLCRAPVQKLTVNVFVNATKKKEAHNFLKTFSEGFPSKFFFH